MKKLITLLLLLISGSLFPQQKDSIPQFPGGEVALKQFISENIIYPEAAINAKIEGITYLSFIVLIDGTIDSIKIDESSHFLLDEEAIRLAYLLPNFIPAYRNGETISSKYTLPIQFKIFDENDLNEFLNNIEIMIFNKFWNEALANIDKVKNFRLNNLSIHEIPNNIDTFPNLELLDLSDNPICILPESFKNLDKVKYLDFSNCKFTEFPIEICDLESLEILDLGSNKINSIPNEILNCKHLDKIILTYCPISKQEQKNIKKQLKGITVKF